jgi:hypothetical protein
MRHATWLKIEASPFWSSVYRGYRTLPESLRRPLRAVTMPRWQLATSLVRHAARHRAVAGPFRGMRIELSPLSSRHLLGYILGTQELELHEAIGEISPATTGRSSTSVQRTVITQSAWQWACRRHGSRRSKRCRSSIR